MNPLWIFQRSFHSCDTFCMVRVLFFFFPFLTEEKIHKAARLLALSFSEHFLLRCGWLLGMTESKKEAWGSALCVWNKTFLRALKMVVAGCVTSINLYNCETGAIIYVTAVRYTKNITLLAGACGPCYMAGMYCSSWLLYITIVLKDSYSYYSYFILLGPIPTARLSWSNLNILWYMSLWHVAETNSGLIDYSINRELDANSENPLIVYYLSSKNDISWLQLLKWKNMVPFSVLHHSRLNMFGLWIAGRTKHVISRHHLGPWEIVKDIFMSNRFIKKNNQEFYCEYK